MKYSNYKECVKHIADLTPFRSNSLYGYNGATGFLVVSYNTSIASIKPDFSQAILNVQKYSVTTSKQQTYVKQAIARIRETHPDIEVIEVHGWRALFDANNPHVVNA